MSLTHLTQQVTRMIYLLSRGIHLFVMCAGISPRSSKGGATTLNNLAELPIIGEGEEEEVLTILLLLTFCLVTR